MGRGTDVATPTTTTNHRGPDRTGNDLRRASRGVRAAYLERPHPGAARGTAAHPGSAAPHATHVGIKHSLIRPQWTCTACEQQWPCPTARDELAAAYDPPRLALIMSDYLYLAAFDLPGAEPGELWDRLLLWTRRR